MVTSPSTSGPSVPKDDLMGSVSRGKTHPPKPISNLHSLPCARRPLEPPFLWENNFSESAPAARTEPRAPCVSSAGHPSATDVDGVTAESSTCNQTPALDAVGPDAEKKYAVQKADKYTVALGLGVESLMFQTSELAIAVELDLFSFTSSFTPTKHGQKCTKEGQNPETAALL